MVELRPLSFQIAGLVRETEESTQLMEKLQKDSVLCREFY